MAEEIAKSRSHRIALILRALEDCDRERAEFMTEMKDRRTKLENQLAQLRDEILDGQQTLPIAGD
jgi:phage host-nuclease inhibitor protein Gam